MYQSRFWMIGQSILIGFGCCATIRAADKPNFIVILTDDQSWVGSSQQMISGDPRTRSDCFGTPNIERLARMGMRFTQGYSPAASCCPTRRALLQTGQVPARHEYSADRDEYFEPFPLEDIQLPPGYREDDLDDLPPAGKKRGPNCYFPHIRKHGQW